MTPILACRTVKNRHRRTSAAGFTLLEILLVLTILGMASILVVPNIGSLENRTFSAQVRQATSLLNYARRIAVVQGQPSTASFFTGPMDPDAMRVATNSVGRWQAGTTTELHFRDSTDQEIEIEELLEISFYPEGGSTGGALLLIQGTQQVEIQIDPFNGRVTTAALED